MPSSHLLTLQILFLKKTDRKLKWCIKRVMKACCHVLVMVFLSQGNGLEHYFPKKKQVKKWYSRKTRMVICSLRESDYCQSLNGKLYCLYQPQRNLLRKK